MTEPDVPEPIDPAPDSAEVPVEAEAPADTPDE